MNKKNKFSTTVRLVLLGYSALALSLASCSNSKKSENRWEDVTDTVTYNKALEKNHSSINTALSDNDEVKTLPIYGNIGLDSVLIESTNQTQEYSNKDGLFKLQGIKTRNGRYVVRFSKEGYFPLVKSEAYNETDNILVKLQKMGDSERTAHVEFNATESKVLNVQDMMIKIPANSLGTILSNEEYNGKVTADIYYLSPNDAEFAERMPGGDLAARNAAGKDVDLFSYGMVNLILKDSTGTPMEFKKDSAATVVFPLPKGMETDVKSMPLWHFNNSTGLWDEQGIAYRQGDLFVGKVGHFSWWNLDSPEERAILRGKVCDKEGIPYSKVMVILSDQKKCVTNNKGEFTSYIPINIDVKIKVIVNETIQEEKVRTKQWGDTLKKEIVINAPSIKVNAKSCHMFKQPVYSLFYEFETGSDTLRTATTIKKDNPVLIPFPKSTKSASIILQTDFGYIKKTVDTKNKGVSVSFDPCEETITPGMYYNFSQNNIGFIWIIDPDKNEFAYPLTMNDLKFSKSFFVTGSEPEYDDKQVRKVSFKNLIGEVIVDYDLNESTYGVRKHMKFNCIYSKKEFLSLQKLGWCGEYPEEGYLTIYDAGYNKLLVVFEGKGDFFQCDRALTGIYFSIYIKKHPSLGEMSDLPPAGDTPLSQK